MIGLQELRKSLGFPPPPAWSFYGIENSYDELALSTNWSLLNAIDPSGISKDLKSAIVQAYYKLKEPRKSYLEHASQQFSEDVQINAVKYMDQREPQIRAVFRQTFENMRRSDNVDRKTVDEMIAEADRLFDKLYTIIEKRLNNKENYMMEYKWPEHGVLTSDHFSFISNNSLISDPRKLLESTKQRSLPSTDFTITSLLDNMDYFTEQEHRMLWKNTFPLDEGKKHTLSMVSSAVSNIASEELLKETGYTKLPKHFCSNYNYNGDKIRNALRSPSSQLWDNKKPICLLFMELLDKRFPEVRMVYKMRFLEMRSKGTLISEGMMYEQLYYRMFDEMDKMNKFIEKMVMEKEIKVEEIL